MWQVVDTDAEGRLCLADGLVFAESLGVEAVVDIATLPGATLTALGDDIAGLFSPNEQLARSLLEAAEHSGVHLWDIICCARLHVVETLNSSRTLTACWSLLHLCRGAAVADAL